MKCISFILFLYTLNNTTDLRSCCVCVLLCVRQAVGWWFVRTETCSTVLCDIKVLCWTVYVACLWFRKAQRDISKCNIYIYILVYVWRIVSMNLCWGVVCTYGNMRCCRYSVVGLPTASCHWHWSLLRALRFANCMFTFTIFEQLKSVIICVLYTITMLDTDHCVRNIW